MPRKKRRGRPPGSKNKSKASGSIGTMDVAQLSDYIAGLRKTLAAKIQQQRTYFERQLAGLGTYSERGCPARTTAVPARQAGTRRKPEPKYQSRKNPKLRWTGRGVTPVWMREEMNGTKLTKDSFLIK